MPGDGGNRTRDAVRDVHEWEVLTSGEGAKNTGRGNWPNYNYKPFGTVLCGAGSSANSLGSISIL